MLNKNINKVRRIAKAQSGLSIPSGNPYMTTNGLAIPGNSTQQNILGTDYGAEFRNRAEQIMALTNNLIDFNAKMGDLFSLKLKNDRDSSKAITQIKSMSGGTTPQKSQQAGDQAFDQASNVVMGINPLVGGIMKAGDLASDILTKYAGMGTDSMTKTDAVLGSKLLSLTPAGMINGFFGKRTRDFSANKATIEQVGGSYGGTVRNINEASEKAGKKYGLFSSGKRKQANRFIDRTESQQSTMTNIAKDASDLSSIATNMSDLNHMQYGFNLNGGYDQRYMRAAKFGAKLKRVKRINFRKQGGEIVGAINLDNWRPVITEAVEQFESGGELEWTPVITEYKQGGKSEELSKEESELEETNQKNIIPEGALHAHKHHMENADNLTKKGIPVVDNDGEQQAEIEKNEIIFTLEVTKRLEELYSKYQDYEYSQKEKDEVAIEAGKLLVEEILFNTDDRTGLINTLQKGGKINGIE